MLIGRAIEQSIRLLATKYPVLAVTGPRQSGKTTLLKSMFPDYQYLSLENPDIRLFAETDPNGFLLKYSEHVIFDEIQRVPALFSYLQTLVDEANIMGRFILSGSQNFHLMHNITQSLAGRVAIFKLFPFDFAELSAAGLLSDHYLKNMIRGFYPAIFDREIPPKIFYSNYLQTYVQRDVSELIAIKDMRLFQNFLGLLAARAGQLLNMNAIANECGISQPTAKSWISALENSYIVFQLFPYHENFSKRIIKTPKIYFYDTGFLCFLLKISDPDKLLMHPIKGHLFENMMIAEYIKQVYHKNDVPDIWFWRDVAGHEIDLIIQKGVDLNLVEFKATQTIMPDLFKDLLYFENISVKQNIKKSLVYGGNDSEQRQSGQVISWKDFDFKV